MDDCGGSPYKGLIATVRKKRSQTPRRLRTGNLTATGFYDQSHLTSHSMEIYNLNYYISRDSSANRFKGDYSKNRQKDGGSSVTYNNAHQGDATNVRHVAYVRQLGNAKDGIANDRKLKKLKSKVGGATSISQTKNSSYGSSGSLLSSKSAQPSDASPDKSSEDGPPTDKKNGLKGISCKDSPRGTFGAGKSNVEKMPKKNVLKKQGEKPRENLKIQRWPRRRLILNKLDEDEDDNEIHYSEKLKLKANKNEMLEDVGSSGKEVQRISNQGFDQYTDYEEQLLSDDEEEEHVCVAPSYVNPYKYWTSKLNLPLCSIRCYKPTR